MGKKGKFLIAVLFGAGVCLTLLLWLGKMQAPWGAATEALGTAAPTERVTMPETIPETIPETMPETVPETVPEPVVVEITISAVGDITLGTNQKAGYDRSFHEYYDTYGEDYFLQNVKHIFEADDFTIVNLEGTLTNAKKMYTPKLWNHKGRPEYIGILKNASVEAVTLGNNHIMDYWEQGVDDTIGAVEDAGIAYALSGEWGNQYGLFETEKGIKIGFVSVNEHYDEEAVYPYLQEGLAWLRAAGADLMIACPHWGDDYVHEIGEEQFAMGRWCIDQGYDLVLGCHPHVLQGIECYKGKYIVYCLGNFCYGGNKNPKEKETMIYQQTFTFVDGVLQENAPFTIIPCRLSSSENKNDYCPQILEGEDAQEVIDFLNELSKDLGVVIEGVPGRPQGD